MRSSRLTPTLVLALGGYVGVIVALTLLKAFFQIGYLWLPENQVAREIRLRPLAELDGTSWFGPVFGYGGNFALFVPLGVLLFILLRRIGPVTAWGFCLSLTVETLQYACGLGRSDIDDLMFNTLGAFAGAAFASWCGPRFHRMWIWLGILATAVFVVLAALGPRLGDPDKVKDVSVSSATSQELPGNA